MLLTSQYKPKGLFGGHAPSGANMTPQIDPAQLMQRNMALGSVQQAMQPKKPGINWLGVLTDALAGAAGREGPYAASMAAQRQQQQQAELAAQQRIQSLQDWQWKKQWERDNPAPVNNDTVNDYNFIAQNLGPEAANQYLRNMGDPIVTVPLPNGQIYTGPRSQMGNVMAGGAQGGNDEWGDTVDIIPGGVGGNTGGGFPVSANQLDRITVQSESAGNPNAVSPKGAMGLWQVMPATARDPGFGITPWNGTSADLNRVGQQYRQKMHTRYGGDLSKMWAAFNWGPGNVDAAIKKHGANWLSHAPAETRNYVARNLRALRGGK